MVGGDADVDFMNLICLSFAKKEICCWKAGIISEFLEGS